MPTFVVPSSYGTLREFNTCHAPGSGQFCSHGKGTYTINVGDREIARANVARDGEGDYLTSVRVEPEYRRKGMATKLYDEIEKDLGRPLRPSPTHQTPEAVAFWDKRGRPIDPNTIFEMGDALFHGSPKHLRTLQPGTMLSDDPIWAAGYTTRVEGGGLDETFIGKIHATKIPSGNTVYARSVHDAEGQLIAMARRAGVEPTSLKHAAEVVYKTNRLDAIIAKNPSGKITGAIILRPSHVTGHADPVETLTRAKQLKRPIPENLEIALRRRR